MSETHYIKRFISKGELPEINKYVTCIDSAGTEVVFRRIKTSGTEWAWELRDKIGCAVLEIVTWLEESPVQPDVDEEKSKTQGELKDIILKECKEGNIVVATFDGIQAMPIKNFIEQPVEGMLYDLNRNEAVVLTFINDPKWINDYAVAQVIRALKSKIDESKTHLRKITEWVDKNIMASGTWFYVNSDDLKKFIEGLSE